MSAIIENAAGGLLADEAYGLIGMLSSRIDAEIKLARGFKKELEMVQGQLTRLTGLLHGASCQSITNPLIVDWLKNIEYVAYDADDLLDQWSYEGLEDKIVIYTRKRDKFKRGVSKPFSRLRIGHRASDLTSLISNIYDDANKLGIRPIDVASGDVYNCEDRETSNKLRNQRNYVDEKLLIGRNEDLTHLVKLICDPNNINSSNLTVISIVGMAGLGKTTLCKRISKEQEVVDFFNSIVIWLVISRSYDLLDVLNRMVEILCRKPSSMKDRQALISELHEKLKDKRYLLILDDVWDTIHWESLKSTLEEIGGSYGTTILVTSRNKDAVGKLVTDCYDSKGKHNIRRPYIYMLQGLSEADSWSLFLARISDDSLVDSEKKVIARRMLKNCGGVPLAIRALGDLLRDQSVNRWKEIEKSHTWTKVDRNDILPSLRLSYDFLPSMTLKKCFAYCAIFEEDEVIDKNKLIYMWMAQGYLQPYDQVMEDKGEEYVEHLLNSSLFQEAELDEYGKVKTFKMHDLVWSLARVVSMGECLCSEGDERSNEVLRHLLVPKQFKSREVTLTSYTKLRTCLLYKEFEHPSIHFWLKCRHLRVLNIGWNWSEDLDWEPLGSLIHLRYFEIDVDNGLGVMQSNLGEHITKLYHLQTLCINNLCIVEDPSITQFPKQIGNLVNLRHILDNDSIGIPMGLGLLTALQTLPAINLEMNRGGRLSDLGSLTNLKGTLEIHNLCFVNGDEVQAHVLNNKSYLDSLVLRWGYNKSPAVKDNPHANKILEALQPNANLKMLQIWNHDGTRFPRWLIEEGSSSLPNLVSLKIYRCKAVGILTLESFRSLRFLQVEYCKRLTIMLPNEGFQCCNSLEQIILVGCYQVNNLGDLSSLTQLRSLTLKNNQLVGLGSLPWLTDLHTDELVLLEHLSEDSPVCKSLEVLTLEGFQLTDNDDHTTVLPDQLKYLTALQCLTIGHSECLETIPDWLGKLTSLRELHLSGLPKLKNLPSLEAMRHLSNLKTLEMAGCPLLLADVESESGEWLKIAHIPPFIHY